MAQLDKLEGIALETLEMLDCKFEGELDRVRALRRVPTLRVRSGGSLQRIFHPWAAPAQRALMRGRAAQLLNHEIVSDETRAAAAQPEAAVAE